MEILENHAPKLVNLAHSVKALITGYDSKPAGADRFVNNLQAVWGSLPDLPKIVLQRHWSTCVGHLSVILTEAAPPWERQKGFASASPCGVGLYFWSPVLERIPEEHLRTDIAHELGHMVFIALGEPGHKRPGYSKAEWLITDLLPHWKFDQVAADEWKERNLDLNDGGPRWKDCPLTEEEYKQQRKDNQDALMKRSKDRSDYREQQRNYFAVATRTCGPELNQIARSDPERLGKILRGEDADPDDPLT